MPLSRRAARVESDCEDLFPLTCTALATAADRDCQNDQLQQDQESELVDHLLDNKPMLVCPGVFIGSLMAEKAKAVLHRHGITDVLQVAEGLYPSHPMQFSYYNLQVCDTPNEDLVVHFPKAFAFIDRAIARGGGVLVHCAAGVSRSATMVLGYLMSRHSMSLDQALQRLKQVRPWVCPNSGFMEQLRQYERIQKDMSQWRSWRQVLREQAQQALALGVEQGQQQAAQQGARQEPREQHVQMQLHLFQRESCIPHNQSQQQSQRQQQRQP